MSEAIGDSARIGLLCEGNAKGREAVASSVRCREGVYAIRSLAGVLRGLTFYQCRIIGDCHVFPSLSWKGRRVGRYLIARDA